MQARSAQRRLGSQGLRVGAVGLGLGWAKGAVLRRDSRAALRLVAQAVTEGVNLLDLSTSRPGGAADALVRSALGRGLRGRDAVTLVTGARSQRLGEDVERSRRSLGTDRLDLVTVHLATSGGPHPAGDGVRVAVEAAVAAAEEMARLVDAGRVRWFGLSGATPDLLRCAHAVHPVSAVSVEYSLRSRRPEGGLLPVARMLGVGVLAVRPFAGGLLTGCPPGTPEPLAGLAASLDLGPPRLALAWLLSRGEDIVAVAGTRDRIHLEMNLSASRIRLPAWACDLLDQDFPADAVRVRRSVEAETNHTLR